MIQLKGIAAAGGISIGPVYKLGSEEFIVVRDAIRPEDIPAQIQLFEEALIKTRREIIELQKRISSDMGQEEAQIFDAHLLVLEDRMLIEDVISRIKKDQLNVAYIFSEVLKKYISVFLKIEDEYLKERAADINDVGKRILRNLLGKEKKSLDDMKEKAISSLMTFLLRILRQCILKMSRDSLLILGERLRIRRLWPNPWRYLR